MGKSALIKTSGVTLSQVNYAGMTATALDNLIKDQHAQCKSLYTKLERNSETLYLALEEMERRFEKQQRYRTDLKPLKAPTWHGYLQSRGVQPAAYRKWKSRRNKANPAALVVIPEINVTTAELARELENTSWSVKLAETIKAKGRITPVVTQRLVTALKDSSNQLAALAAQFDTGAQLSEKAKADRTLRQAGTLKVVPLHLREANELVAKLHRHHKPIRVAKFSIGASKDGKLVEQPSVCDPLVSPLMTV